MAAVITQKDIAKKLGVSVTLVSRVLSGKSHEIGAASATVESIQKTANDMGYVPNATARILKGAPSRTLGVVVYDFEDPFLGAITGALQRLAHAHDYTLVLVGFDQRRVDAQTLRPLSKHGLSGMIVVGSGSNDDWLDVFRARHMRVARIGSGPTANQATVAIDNADGMEKLLNHLALRNYLSAGFIGDIHPAHQERLHHFTTQAARHGIVTGQEWKIIRSEPGAMTGYKGAQTLIANHRRSLPRALVAASDAIAMGALRAFQEHKINVPGEIALTGFDGIPFADMITPALTTVRQPVQAMAQTAFEWISGDPPATLVTKGPIVLLKGELVVREST
jgi:LacI family transcriptional regulator